MLHLYKHSEDTSPHPTEIISPTQATHLLTQQIEVKSILEATEDDHELCLVVTCQTNYKRYLTIAMEYCCAHDTEWGPLFCWALTNQHQRVHEFMTTRLREELLSHQEMDMRDI